MIVIVNYSSELLITGMKLPQTYLKPSYKVNNWIFCEFTQLQRKVYKEVANRHEHKELQNANQPM